MTRDAFCRLPEDARVVCADPDRDSREAGVTVGMVGRLFASPGPRSEVRWVEWPDPVGDQLVLASEVEVAP